MSKLERFKIMYENALNRNLKYMGVAITIGESKTPEFIINTRENFDSKMKYYVANYDENLRLKSAKDIDIIITSCAFDNNIEILMNTLEGK